MSNTVYTVDLKKIASNVVKNPDADSSTIQLLRGLGEGYRNISTMLRTAIAANDAPSIKRAQEALDNLTTQIGDNELMLAQAVSGNRPKTTGMGRSA